MGAAICEEAKTKIVEYGGLLWQKREESKDPTYMARNSSVGRFRVSQYPDDGLDRFSGKWHWHVDFDRLASEEFKPKALSMDVAGIQETMQEAMLACLDARGAFIEDMRQLLSLLCPGDEYAQGRRAGQEEIKQRLINFLQ